MSVSNLCLAINSIKRLPEPREAYSCRQGPGISVEIETTYPLRTRYLPPGRQGPGISVEIETKSLPVSTPLIPSRQGPGISVEIET